MTAQSEFSFFDPIDWNGDGQINAYDQIYETIAWEEHCRQESSAKNDSGSNNIWCGHANEDEDETTEEINESDFPNKRRYYAACELADDSDGDENEYLLDKKECCRFIVENADTVLAANYLSPDGEFLYSQAIKDNFTLPITLPDEDENREFELYQAIRKIARKDFSLSFDVWSWVLDNFLPYEQYDDYARENMISDVVRELRSFPDNYVSELVRYMDGHHDFRQKISDESGESISDFVCLIVAAIEENLDATATAIFETCLNSVREQWKDVNELTEQMIFRCKNYSDVEKIEYFRDNLFPLIKEIDDGMVSDEIEIWEKDIAEYIDSMERNGEKYAYSRRHAWRKTVPDGKEYGLNPIYYETEQEYMQAFQEEKYGWRQWCKGQDTLGLNVEDFETQDSFREAFNKRLNEKRQNERELRKTEYTQKRFADGKEYEEYTEDKTVYTVCGVFFGDTPRPYYFKTEDNAINIGDKVFVCIGDHEVVGKVVSVGSCLRVASPFPIDKMKTIV